MAGDEHDHEQDDDAALRPTGPRHAVPMDAEPADDQGSTTVTTAASPGALVGITVPAEPGPPPASPASPESQEGDVTAPHEDQDAP